jgi:hypothetical protein
MTVRAIPGGPMSGLGCRPGYVAQCNDDWEHEYGINITTLDNPGWSITIDLTGTDLDAATYARREVHRSEDDWCSTWTENAAFQAACGPTNLAEALHEFRLWVSDRTS